MFSFSFPSCFCLFSSLFIVFHILFSSCLRARRLNILLSSLRNQSFVEQNLSLFLVFRFSSFIYLIRQWLHIFAPRIHLRHSLNAISSPLARLRRHGRFLAILLYPRWLGSSWPLYTPIHWNPQRPYTSLLLNLIANFFIVSPVTTSLTTYFLLYTPPFDLQHLPLTSSLKSQALKLPVLRQDV